MAQTAKNLPATFPDLVPGLGISPGEWNGNPLQYCCLENPMERAAWRAIVHGITKSQTRLRDLHFQDKYLGQSQQRRISSTFTYLALIFYIIINLFILETENSYVFFIYIGRKPLLNIIKPSRESISRMKKRHRIADFCHM